MFKKILLLFVLVVVLSSGSFASNMVLGTPNGIFGFNPMVLNENGVQIAPIRILANSAGYDVLWINETNQILLTKVLDEIKTDIIIDINSATISKIQNGATLETAEFYPILKNGSFYAGLEFFANYLGLKYNVNSEFYRVNLETEFVGNENVKFYKPLISYKESEIRNMAKLLYFETRGSSIKKITAVGNVIVNRVLKPNSFGSSIDEVIFARNQFPPTTYPKFKTIVPASQYYFGVWRAIHGDIQAKNILYFNLVPFKSKAKDFAFFLEGDYFYY